MLSVPLELNFITKGAFSTPIMNLAELAHAIWLWFCLFVRFLALLMFLEILYSFYRLAETIFSILNTRRNYLEDNR